MLESRRLDFSLEEYGRIKEEMLAAITAQHTTMTYALAAAAAIFAGLLNVWDDYDVRMSILSLGPLLLAFLWFIWLGELTRMARAARFLYDRELAINAYFRERAGSSPVPAFDSVLDWESWVRGGNRWGRNLHLGLTYALSTCALFGIAVVSTIISVVLVIIGPHPAWLWSLVLSCAVVVTAMAVLGVWVIRTSPVLARGL